MYNEMQCIYIFNRVSHNGYNELVTSNQKNKSYNESPRRYRTMM